MHPTDTNFQKLTGEWNKKRRAFLKEMFNKNMIEYDTKGIL